MKKTVIGAQQMLADIKTDMQMGIINYDTAKDLSKIPLKIINDEAAIVAKRFGRKHYKITFTAIMR